MAEQGLEIGLQPGCSGECAHCAIPSHLEDAPFKGGRLALASLVTFLLPLILGCIGAGLLGPSGLKSLLGGLGGLVLGAVLSAVFMKRLQRNSG